MLDDMVLILVAGNWHDIVRLSKTTTTAITVLTFLTIVIHLLKKSILVQFPVAAFGNRFCINILDTTICPSCLLNSTSRSPMGNIPPRD
jgi:hypothetical protein